MQLSKYITVRAIQAIQGCFSGGRTDAFFFLRVLDSTRRDPTYSVYGNSLGGSRRPRELLPRIPYIADSLTWPKGVPTGRSIRGLEPLTPSFARLGLLAT